MIANFLYLDVETRLQMSEAKKEEGNTLFSKACYSQAIILCPENAALYSNRAACHIALKDSGSGLEDASKSIELDPNYAKGYFRAAKACILGGELEKAREYFNRVCELDPEGVTLEERKNLEALEKTSGDLREYLEQKDHARALDTIKVIYFISFH